MNFQTDTCVLVFMALLFASILMQWVRARSRENLVLTFDIGVLGTKDQQMWLSIQNSFDPIFKNFRMLRIFKRNLSRYPGNQVSKYKRYCTISRLEMTVTASMLIFGTTAFLYCGR
jgi:hypothetical protein